MDSRFGKFVSVIAAILITAGIAAAAEKTMTPLEIPMIGDVKALAAGDKAPGFETKDLTGATFSYKPEAGNPTLLVFWSIFCEPCRDEMPLVQSMYEKYKAKGFSVVAVTLDGNLEENIRQFVKQGKYTFTVLLDQESKDGSLVVAEKFNVPGTPTLYMVDAKGLITFAKVGRTTEAELEKAITDSFGK